MSNPTLRDVAKYAGVSLGTASRALNNKDNILPDTRSRVLRAASELGYKLQFRVPSSVSSKLNTIGVIIKREHYESHDVDLFNYGILGGIEDECRRLGMNVMFSTIKVDQYSHAVEISPIINESTVDGLIMVGVVLEDKHLCEQLPKNKPIVFVDGAAECGEFDSIVIDNYMAAYNMVSYLIEEGHKHIALVGSAAVPHEHPSIRTRLQGYRDALDDAGIKQSYITATTMDLCEVKDATRQMLNEHPQITAIFACNDLIATEVCTVVYDLNLYIPDDISVVGFDNVDISANARPPLTTMHVDRNLLGTLAVRRLYDRATNLNSVPIEISIGTRLIHRQSVSTISQLR